MYEIIFYKNKNGESDIENYLDALSIKSKNSKTDRINHTKIFSYLVALSKYGTRIGHPTVKHIEGSIWELRPLKNRIFFFYWKDNKFVLLHHYIKKSQKTPKKELEKARLKLKDFIERSGY